jgi:hypothetical protein
LTDSTRDASDERVTWPEAWGGLRERRIALLCAAPAAFILGMLLWDGPTAFGLAVVAFFGAAWALRTWRCPRCQERFAGAAGRWWPNRCAACRLPEFSSVPFSRETTFTVDRRAARSLSSRFRRLVAVSEIAGGAAVMLLIPLTIVQGVGLAWWYATFVEGLGVFGIVAGYWLWRDDARGYGLSRLVQGLQMLKIQLAGVVFDVSAGLEVNLTVSNAATNFGAGIRGAFSVAVGQARPHVVIVNVLAAIALILLWNAEPAHSTIGDERHGANETPAPELSSPAAD